MVHGPWSIYFSGVGLTAISILDHFIKWFIWQCLYRLSINYFPARTIPCQSSYWNRFNLEYTLVGRQCNIFSSSLFETFKKNVHSNPCLASVYLSIGKSIRPFLGCTEFSPVKAALKKDQGASIFQSILEGPILPGYSQDPNYYLRSIKTIMIPKGFQLVPKAFMIQKYLIMCGCYNIWFSTQPNDSCMSKYHLIKKQIKFVCL